jgi:hypothetical protein
MVEQPQLAACIGDHRVVAGCNPVCAHRHHGLRKSGCRIAAHGKWAVRPARCRHAEAQTVRQSGPSTLRLSIPIPAGIALNAPAFGHTAGQNRERSAQPLFVPVLADDFPDAFILPVGKEFLRSATNSDGDRANVQMARSTDIMRWSAQATPAHPK